MQKEELNTIVEKSAEYSFDEGNSISNSVKSCNSNKDTSSQEDITPSKERDITNYNGFSNDELKIYNQIVSKYNK